jgi:4-hydroxy-2-oxoheptanedioate aldolase
LHAVRNINITIISKFSKISSNVQTMQTPINHFKQVLAQQQPQIGLWMGLGSTVTTDICAGAGFDWLVIDGEHGPNDLTTLLAQLQVVAAYPNTQAVVRVPHDNAALLKQVLDIGATTVLVPMVDTAEQAAAIVKSCRYPQDDGQGGIRGMAGSRASRWGRYPNYAQEANAQVCVLVQVETREALKNLDAIAATDGVDGVFIGPADLSASLGHVGDAAHPEVQAAIVHAIARIRKAGKAPGILMNDEARARHCLSMGAVFVAVGMDSMILAKQTSALAAKYKDGLNEVSSSNGAY